LGIRGNGVGETRESGKTSQTRGTTWRTREIVEWGSQSAVLLVSNKERLAWSVGSRGIITNH